MKNLPLNANKTAIKRNQLSLPVKWLIKQRIINKGQSILDYGCGRGDDIRHLNRLGFKVFGYDPYWQNNHSILNQKYDVILNTYVLNVVGREQRKNIINQIKDLTKPSGNVYITVRRDVKVHRVSKIGTHQFPVRLNARVIRETSTYCMYEL